MSTITDRGNISYAGDKKVKAKGRVFDLSPLGIVSRQIVWRERKLSVVCRFKEDSDIYLTLVTFNGELCLADDTHILRVRPMPTHAIRVDYQIVQILRFRERQNSDYIYRYAVKARSEYSDGRIKEGVKYYACLGGGRGYCQLDGRTIQQQFPKVVEGGIVPREVMYYNSFADSHSLHNHSG